MVGGQNSTGRYLDPLSDTDPRPTEDRISFLRALRDTNADVLKSLFEEVYPNYRQIWTQIEQCQTPTGLIAVQEKCETRWGPGVIFARVQNDISRWGIVTAADAGFRFYPEVASLKDDLVAWASKFHLLNPCPKQAMIRATWGSSGPDPFQIGERSGRGDSSGPETGENDNTPQSLHRFWRTAHWASKFPGRDGAISGTR